MYVQKQQKRFALFLIFALLFSQFSFLIPSVYAASSPWTQTDWSSESGTNVDTTTTSGQITLTNTEELSNTGFETDLTSWDTPDYSTNIQNTQSDNLVAYYPLNDASGNAATATNVAVSEGRDIVINGDFDSDTSWTKGTGWTIGSGVASSDGSQTATSSLYQDIAAIVIGKSYSVTFTVSNYSAGTVRVHVGDSGGGGTIRSANGTYTETITASGTVSRFYVNADGNFVGSIDNVSVKQVDILASSYYPGSELLTDGDMEAEGTGAWTASTATLSKQTGTRTEGSGTNVLRLAENGAVSGLARQTVLTTGKSYRITGWARGDGTGRPEVRDHNGITVWLGSNSTDWQSFDYIFISPGANINLRGGSFVIGGGQYAEFDDVSVTEVNPLNGTVSGATMGATGIGDGETSYSFDGSNDYVNIYSSEINSVFNPDAGTLLAWAKVSDAGVWEDGSYRAITYLAADANNQIKLLKWTTNNQMAFGITSGGTSKSVYDTSLNGSTNIFMVAMMWDKTADEFKAFINGSQVGTTQTGLGTWVGNLSSTGTILGGGNTTPIYPWSGSIGHTALWNTALTPTEIAALYADVVTSSHDTSTTYNSSSGAAKIIAVTDSTFTQSVNVGDTNEYNLTAYAYTDGSAVTSADAELYYNGSTITTTYTDMGSNWYKLSGTLTGADASRTYGVQVKSGKTVYLDDFSLNSNASSGTLTSSIYDTEQVNLWGTLSYTATTPTNTAATVKIRTGDSSDLSDATAFDSCLAITNGDDISGNGCVTDLHRYVQYQVGLTTTDNSITPTFSDVSISFAKANVETTLDSPGGDSYTESERPIFRWKVGSDAESATVTSYKVEIDNGDTGDFSFVNIPVNRTSDYETSKYIAKYEGFGDSDTGNNYISVYTKSSPDWTSTENDGKLKEGRRSWSVKAIGATGDEYIGSRTLFVDRTGPNTEITGSDNAVISGKVTDVLMGDKEGNRVASGPKSVEIKVEKQTITGLYDLYSLVNVNLEESSLDTSSNKYVNFAHGLAEELTSGQYKITVIGKDHAGNTGGSATVYLKVGVTYVSRQPTPKPTLAPEEKDVSETEEAQEEEVKEVEKVTTVEVVEPTGPNIFQKALTSIASGAGRVYWSLVGVGKTGVGIMAGGWNIYSGFVNSTNQMAIAYLGGAWSGIGHRAQALANAASSGLEFAANKAVGGIAFIFDQTGSAYNNLAQNAPGVARTILTGIGNGVSTTTSAIASATRFTAAGAVTLAQGIGGSVSAGGNAIAGVTGKAFGGARNILANVVFGVGQQTQHVSGQLGFAIVKIGYIFVNEPTTIYDVKVETLSATEAKVTWKTNHPANGKVNYGLDESYSFDVQSEDRVIDHEFILTNLSPDTEYHFEVMSQNKNYVYDANRKFKTPPLVLEGN